MQLSSPVDNMQIRKESERQYNQNLKMISDNPVTKMEHDSGKVFDFAPRQKTTTKTKPQP